MSATPFMQLYVGDYLADTLDLTTEQHGAYLLLLMTMWRHGAKLPNDPAKLARIARVSARRWHMVWSEIGKFFYEDDDSIRNKRLDQEHQKAVSLSEKRSASGAKGGAAKALKYNNAAVATATDLPKHSHKSEPYSNTPIAPKGDEGRFQEFWDAYPHRHGQRKNGKGAEARFRAAIKRGVTADEILSGVYAMKRFPDVQRGYARDPDTWLNQQGWTDEPPSAELAVINGGKPYKTDAKGRPEIGSEMVNPKGERIRYVNHFDGWMSVYG